VLFKKILQAALYIGISPTAYFIEPQPIQNDEIVKLALKKNNPQICLQQWSLIQFSFTNPIGYNRWICLKDVAEHLKDPNVCDLIKVDQYRSCIQKVARVDKKFSTCDKLVNDPLYMG